MLSVLSLYFFPRGGPKIQNVPNFQFIPIRSETEVCQTSCILCGVVMLQIWRGCKVDVVLLKGWYGFVAWGESKANS